MPDVEALFSPDGDRVGDRICLELASGAWTSVSAAVAFVKLSGVKHVAQPLLDFGVSNPGGVSLTVGIDHGGSSVEAVADLFSIVAASDGHLFVAHNPASPKSTFHPKLWFFSDGQDERLLILGSGNLTGGGLFTNYEANAAVRGTATDDVMVKAEELLAGLSDVARPDVVEVDAAVLQRLHDQGDLPSEHESRRILVATESMRRARRSFLKALPLFRGRVNRPGSDGGSGYWIPTPAGSACWAA